MYNLSKKLMLALRTKGLKFTMNTRQFIGYDGNAHNYYIINRALWNSDTHRWVNNELYGSSSMLRIMFYLRDMWFLANGQELPTDQEQWNSARKELQKNGKYGSWIVSEVTDGKCQ